MTTLAQRAQLDERFIRATAKLGWIIAGILMVALLWGVFEHNRQTRATVPKVAGMASVGFDPDARAALNRTVDSIGFPEQAGSGFRAIGGSTFTIDGRDAATVIWARGPERINYTIVSGTEHINYELGNRALYVRVGGVKRELNWVGDIVTFKRNSRTVVVTGTPPSPELAEVMRRLATQL